MRTDNADVMRICYKCTRNLFFVLFFNGLSDWHSAKNVVSEENRAEIRKKNNILSKNCINFHSIFSCFKRKVKMLKITKSCFLWVLRTERSTTARDWMPTDWKLVLTRRIQCYEKRFFIVFLAIYSWYRIVVCVLVIHNKMCSIHTYPKTVSESVHENELCNVYPSIIITNAVYLHIQLCTFVYISWS